MSGQVISTLASGGRVSPFTRTGSVRSADPVSFSGPRTPGAGGNCVTFTREVAISSVRVGALGLPARPTLLSAQTE